ncbi:hypothetical protein M427DRAFT_461401 [Gonapodya prolifera JEL478]|uniref:Uncharacterized protein n=1 Tax=Gonapodya prolifera (strain JEL478) TaxID=1344416 RepID=A0A139A2K2_GONPJ|nr:hypothetical protein M427DRAFT_461401 [Gonapodya prolifera JEL478]|eukprot:KXS10775.1 hypothetical protein M427DRAFT_461401 [Gonapodya prolifera JEL478]
MFQKCVSGRAGNVRQGKPFELVAGGQIIPPILCNGRIAIPISTSIYGGSDPPWIPWCSAHRHLSFPHSDRDSCDAISTRWESHPDLASAHDDFCGGDYGAFLDRCDSLRLDPRKLLAGFSLRLEIWNKPRAREAVLWIHRIGGFSFQLLAIYVLSLGVSSFKSRLGVDVGRLADAFEYTRNIVVILFFLACFLLDGIGVVVAPEMRDAMETPVPETLPRPTKQDPEAAQTERIEPTETTPLIDSGSQPETRPRNFVDSAPQASPIAPVVPPFVPPVVAPATEAEPELGDG